MITFRVDVINSICKQLDIFVCISSCSALEADQLVL